MNNFCFTILVISCFLISTNALFDTSPNWVEIENFRQIQDVITLSDQLVSLFFYNTYDCSKCQQSELTIDRFSDDLVGLVKFYHIDCDKIWDEVDMQTRFPICNPKNIKELPQLVFYAPPVNRINPETGNPTQPKEYVYTGEVSVKAIAKFAKDILPAFRETLKTKNDLDQFLSYGQIPNKVILFTDRDETPTLYRGLTAEFRDKLYFGEVNENADELIRFYNVKKFPTLLILTYNEGTKDYEKEIYKGSIKYEKIAEYLKSYAATERLIKQPERGPVPSQDSTPKPDIKELTSGNFENEIRGDVNGVFVHFTKGEEHPAWEDSVERFENLFHYYHLNCQSEDHEEYALEVLKIKSFPSITFYPFGSKKKVSKYVFDHDYKFEDIVKDLDEYVDDKSLSLTLENSRSFITENLNQQKSPIIFLSSDQDEEAILYYKGYSNVDSFNDKLSFARFKNPTKVIMNTYNIQKLPALFAVLGKSEVDHQVAHFNSDFTSKNIRQFLADVRGRTLQKSQESKNVREINSQDAFDLTCGKVKFCLIAFFDSVKEKDKKFISQLDMLEKAYSKSNYRNEIAIGWINGPCFPEVMARVRLVKEALPTLIAYQQSSSMYAPFLDYFKEEKILKYIEGLFSKKVGLTNPKEELDIDDRDCKEYLLKLKEEERKKKEKEEKLLKQQKEREELERKKEEQRKKEDVKITTKKKEKRQKRKDDL